MRSAQSYNPLVDGLRFVSVELIGAVLYYPIWWYTAGMVLTLKGCMRSIAEQYQYVGLGVWVKNIFVPMFGQYDWEGRLISFVVRFLQIIVRSIVMVIWISIVVACFGLWLIAPLYIVYQISRQVIGLI